MLEGDLSQASAQDICGIVIRPTAVFVIRGQDTKGQLTHRRIDQSRITTALRHGSGLMGNLGPGGEEPRDLGAIVAGIEVFQHRLAGGRTDQLTRRQSLEQTEHLPSRRAAQTELLAALGKDRRVAPVDLGVQLGVLASHLGHGLSRGWQADLIDHQVGCGVVREGNHQAHGIAQGKPRSGREMGREDPRTGHLVVLRRVSC